MSKTKGFEARRIDAIENHSILSCPIKGWRGSVDDGETFHKAF